MKKFFFLIFLIFIFLIFILLLEFISKQFLSKNYGTKYSKETLTIYKKYYNTVNHLRNPWQYNSQNLIYSTVGNGKNSIVFQGDSWSEELLREKNINKLFNFSNKNNLKSYLFGTVSYSPSLYNAQLELILNEFNIKPKQIVSIIDHSDIGDELCRYKDSLKEVNGKYIVLPFVDSNEQQIFDLDNTFRRLNILLSSNYNLIKLVKLFHLKFEEKLNENRQKKCSGEKILSYLEMGISDIEKEYLIEILKRYFVNILKIKELEKFIIVTHPHKKHLTNHYILKIDELIQAALRQIPKDLRVTILDFDSFAKNFISDDTINSVFFKNDNFSHLNSSYYNKYFLEIILNEINKKQK